MPVSELNDVHLKTSKAKWEPIVVMEEMCQIMPEYYGVHYPTILDNDEKYWGKSYFFYGKDQRPNWFIKEIEKYARWAVPLVKNIKIMFKYVQND